MTDTTNTPSEEWRPVEGWPYEVSSLGNVRRVGAQKNRNPGFNGAGYLTVAFTMPRAGEKFCQKSFSVHVLVAAAFLKKEPGQTLVRHLDGNRGNNVVTNLRWGTPLENSADSQKHGAYKRGDRCSWATISEKMVCEILKDYRCAKGVMKKVPNGTISSLSKKFCLPKEKIMDVIHGKWWRHLKR